MAEHPLQNAADSLGNAADAATDDEARDRLREQSSQLEGLAAGDRDVDHGRLARHEHILKEIADDEGGDVAEYVDDALASISAFRETLEGV